MVSRLPEMVISLAKYALYSFYKPITGSLYVSLNKNVMPMAEVVKHLVYCHQTPISKVDVEKALNYISGLAPEWMQIESGAKTLLRIQKSVKSMSVVQKIHRAREALKAGNKI
jgi:hypothetical protein